MTRPWRSARWLIPLLLAQCTGTVHPQGTVTDRISVPGPLLSAIAWLPDGQLLIQSESAPPTIPSSQMRLISPDRSVRTLSSPEHGATCDVIRYTPSVQADGMIGVVARCVPPGFGRITYGFFSYDLQTESVVRLVDDTPTQLASVVWDRGNQRALIASDDPICTGMRWVPSGPAITIRKGERVFDLGLALSDPDDCKAAQAGWPAWRVGKTDIAFFASTDASGLRGFDRVDVRYTLYLLKPVSLQSRGLLDEVQHPSSLSWSPDGRWLAFCGSILGVMGVWIFKPSDGRTALIYQTDNTPIAWGPDGSRLAVGRDGDPDGQTNTPSTVLIFDVAKVTADDG